MLGADTNRDKKDVIDVKFTLIGDKKDVIDVKFTLIGRGYGVLAVVIY
jgi:hypothetical protein